MDQIEHLRQIVSRVFVNSDGRLPVIYFLYQPERIGELSQACLLLKNTYSPVEHQLFMVHPRLTSKARYFSRDTYNIAMRDIVPIEAHNAEEDSAYLIKSLDPPVFDLPVDNRTVKLVVGGISYLERLWLEAHPPAGPAPRRRPFVLTDIERERGEALERRLGIEPQTPVVVLHVREHGLLGLDYCRHRNADIAHYEKALRLLTDRGYAVIRIGDPLCKPLPFEIPGVHDTTTLTSYDRIGDPYFISRCAFMIHTASGPSTLAIAFGKPALATNTPLSTSHLVDNERLVYKEYRNLRTGKAMGLREIFEAGLLDTGTDAALQAAGCELIENDPDMLARAALEMADHVEGKAQPQPPLLEARARFNAFGQRVQQARKSDPVRVAEFRDTCWLGHPGTKLAEAFLDRFPAFLNGIEEIPSL